MSRERVLGPQAPDDARDDEPAVAPQALPAHVHARVIRLGPGHAPALGELLIAHPRLSARILAVASPRMGLSAVRAAIAMTPQRAAGTAAGPATDAAAEPGPVEASPAATSPPAAIAAAPIVGEAEAPASEGASARPSPAAIAAARAYHRAHGAFVARFNAATARSCVGPDGELDPIAVWRWQAERGIRHDGCVGPESAATAAAASQHAQPVSVIEPAAPSAPAPSTTEVAAPTAEVAAPTAEVAAPPAEVAAPTAEVAVRTAPAPATPASTTATPTPASTTATPTTPAPATPAPQAAAGGGQPDVATAPPVPVRPDNGGPGSLARRALGKGSATLAFKQLANDNDAKLNANLADYGNPAEQRALLDAVIAEGADATLVKTAFHAYWHVEVAGLDARNLAQRWPVEVLQAIHRQLKVLPDRDARTGAWAKLSLKNDGQAIDRGFFGGGEFSIVGHADRWTQNDWKEGYAVTLTAAAAANAPTLEVSEGGRFRAGDKLALDRTGSARELVTIASVAGNRYTLGAPLDHEHPKGATLEPDSNLAAHKVNWLDYTVRHEIAHSIDGKGVDGKGFYALGDWHTNSPLVLDQWVTAMGGASARQGNGIAIPDDMPKGTPAEQDRSWYAVKLATNEAISRGASSLFAVNRALSPYQGKGIPIIDAVEAALRGGRSFYNDPGAIYAANNKRFSINFEQGQIQHHSETAMADRVTNYAVSAPAEFFAEAYAVFYEEAGKPGITDADHGRQLRNTTWRDWIRTNVHNRGKAPAGTGAAKPKDAKHPGGEDAGARDEGPSRGKKAGNSGL